MKADEAIALATLLVCRLVAAGTGDILQTAAEVNDAVERRAVGAHYDVTAKLVSLSDEKLPLFHAADETGMACFGMDPAIRPSIPTNAGDIVRIEGVVIPTSKDKVGLHSVRITLVSHGEPIEALQISGKDFYGRDNMRNRLVRIKGVVYDAMRDEIDYQWSFLVLNSDDTIIYAAISSERLKSDDLDRLIGSTVSVEGIVTDHYYGNRITLKRYLLMNGFSAVRVLSHSPADSFKVPEISKSYFPAPSNPFKDGRRRVCGTVVATWRHGRRALVKDGSGNLICTELNSATPPRIGERIEVSGFQETDFYRTNLSRAVWRRATYNGTNPEDGEPPARMNARDVFTDNDGHEVKNMQLFGKTVTIRGIVRSISTFGSDTERIYVESDDFLLPVDASACPDALDDVSVGCTLDITGICIAETENWSATRMFPSIREIFIAVRTPQDVTLIARPPWWTPVRLVTLIGALLAVLLGIFAWNVALRRRAELRGKELADEQLAHVASELKVVERTRLAVELHDSLSQTLTGISMGIDSALDIAGDASEELKKQLNYTSKTVEACRTELRNCLWDLRSQALEESDMNAAIQLALSQIVSKTALNVRFAVPRVRLSDKTTHTILRIIRELATNAVRHGHASAIKIAGSIDGEKLRFSVIDNGTGFDPDHAAGVGEGHFGLEGIRERVDRLDGEVDISSSHGRGTKVTVAFDIPPAKIEGGHGNG